MNYNDTRKLRHNAVRKFRYFYINGKLHKTIRLNRSKDEIVAWCYSEHQRRLYQWSHIQKYASRGFTMGQVSKMVHRTDRMISNYFNWGLMKPPEMTYSLQTGVDGYRIFSEEDIYKLLDVISGMHRGRPRSDGMIVCAPTATKQEIYAQIKHDLVLYAKNDKGEFIPLYAAEDW